MSDPAPSWDSYAARWSALHGGYDLRKASPLVRGWLRLAYLVARLVVPLRISPNMVTLLGLLLAGCVPLLASRGAGWVLLSAVLVVVGALADSVDGAIAVLGERASRLGQVYDSVADRLAEVAWLGALALVGAPAWLVVLCGGLAWLHEYVRARATPAGMADIGAVTVAERPTRVLVAAFGLFFAGLGGLVSVDLATGTATVGVAIWTVLGVVGLAQLAGAVRRTLKEGPPDNGKRGIGAPS